MADVEGAVVEPDVGLDADCACLEGGVEGDLAPVVIVRVLDELGSVGGAAKMKLGNEFHLQTP